MFVRKETLVGTYGEILDRKGENEDGEMRNQIKDTREVDFENQEASPSYIRGGPNCAGIVERRGNIWIWTTLGLCPHDRTKQGIGNPPIALPFGGIVPNGHEEKGSWGRRESCVPRSLGTYFRESESLFASKARAFDKGKRTGLELEI